ncbi:hypothetical protein [Halomarina oriensis]|uniref:Uncharacterized protein n=1 Tax=Halomarina oriensis TaxID=671145 RepID=A0A6B0GMP0_9EURY|nr:hypothetical protein [Halomarina oriensis]MWG36132.1 hypothetical protein [Halomarina oriensis]
MTPPSVTLACLVRLLTVASVGYGLLSDAAGLLAVAVVGAVVVELVLARGVWSRRRWAWSAALGADTVTAGAALAVGLPLAAVATAAVVVVLFVHRDRFE